MCLEVALEMPKVYVASPMGFSEVTRPFMNEKVLPMLRGLGLEVIDPWSLTPQSEVDNALAIADPVKKEKALKELRFRIGQRNDAGIKAADFLVANLDGQEMDSGTASEIGAAGAMGKPIFAWRNDFRCSGELGAYVNLQVEYFIYVNGGTIVKSLDELVAVVKRFLAA